MWTDPSRGVSGNAEYWGKAYVERNAQWAKDQTVVIPGLQKQITDLTAQVSSQQVQIDKLNAQIKELGSKPVSEDQAAQVVADTVKPSVSFIQKVINLLRGKK
jgi:uncharacterized coiled-coil protein SlyX